MYRASDYLLFRSHTSLTDGYLRASSLEERARGCEEDQTATSTASRHSTHAVELPSLPHARLDRARPTARARTPDPRERPVLPPYAALPRPACLHQEEMQGGRISTPGLSRLEREPMSVSVSNERWLTRLPLSVSSAGLFHARPLLVGHHQHQESSALPDRPYDASRSM